MDISVINSMCKVFIFVYECLNDKAIGLLSKVFVSICIKTPLLQFCFKINESIRIDKVVRLVVLCRFFGVISRIVTPFTVGFIICYFEKIL